MYTINGNVSDFASTAIVNEQIRLFAFEINNNLSDTTTTDVNGDFSFVFFRVRPWIKHSYISQTVMVRTLLIQLL